MSKPTYYLFLVIIWLSISVAGPLVYYSGAPGSVCAFWRLLISSIILLPLWLRDRRLHKLQLLGGVFLGAHFISWMESLYLVPIGVSTAIVVAYPVWSVLIDKYVLRERISLYEAIGIAGATISIMLYFSPSVSGKLDPLGLLLALIGSLFAALYFSIGRHLRRYIGYSLSSYVFPVYLTAWITTFVYNLILGIDLYNYPMKSYIAFIVLALIPMLGGHTLMNYLLRFVKTSKVTSIALAEPVGASLIAYLAFNQTLTLSQVILMLMIITFVILTQKQSS